MIEVGLVLGLGGYFALLLWCHKQGNVVIPLHALIGLRVRRYMITFTLAFEPFIESMARAAAAAEKAHEAIARVVNSSHLEGRAADVAPYEKPEFREQRRRG